MSSIPFFCRSGPVRICPCAGENPVLRRALLQSSGRQYKMKDWPQSAYRRVSHGISARMDPARLRICRCHGPAASLPTERFSCLLGTAGGGTLPGHFSRHGIIDGSSCQKKKGLLLPESAGTILFSMAGLFRVILSWITRSTGIYSSGRSGRTGRRFPGKAAARLPASGPHNLSDISVRTDSCPDPKAGRGADRCCKMCR